MARIRVQCVGCGRDLDRYPSQIRKLTFCTNACQGEWKRAQERPIPESWVSLTCEQCGAVFKVMACAAERRRHCSWQCKSLSQVKQRVCVECGESYPSGGRGLEFCSRACYRSNRLRTHRPMTEAHKAKLLKANLGRPGLTGRANPMFRHGSFATAGHICPTCGRSFRSQAHQIYCSRDCAAAQIRAKIDAFYTTPEGRAALLAHATRCRGSRNKRWRGGAAATPYGPGFTPLVKRSILRRDGYRCRRCSVGPGQRGGLVIHHVDRDKANHEPANLMTLCRVCHGEVHGAHQAMVASR